MITWLRAASERRPARVDGPPAEGAQGARVESDLGAGSIVLAGPRGDVALVWKAGDGRRERLLPPGDYRLRTTRSERTEKGEHWFVSSTGPPGEPRALEPGEVARFEVDDSVHFEGQARWQHGSLQLGFAVKGADGRGLSVYRAGRRVPVDYALLDRAGEVLTGGRMNYG